MEGDENMNCAETFYNKFKNKVSEIMTPDQRSKVLSDMAEYFEKHVRSEPENRNQLSEVYQQLKLQCWEVG